MKVIEYLKKFFSNMAFMFRRTWKYAKSKYFLMILDSVKSTVQPFVLLIIPKYIASALQDKDLVVYGSGGQTRSFCWVGDTVDALVRMMESSDKTLSPVNIGSSHEITINALAKKVIELTGSRSKIIHINSPADTRRHETPDVTKARRVLSWSSETSLDEGLRRCAEYMESRLGVNREVYARWM